MNRIELSNSEVACALDILAGRQEGNKEAADFLLRSIIDKSDLIAELPVDFDIKQFQIKPPAGAHPALSFFNSQITNLKHNFMKPIPNETELHIQYQKETGKSRPFGTHPFYTYIFYQDIEVELTDEELSDIMHRVFNRCEKILLPQEIANYIEWLESKINSK